jgi:hypothetical protein
MLWPEAVWSPAFEDVVKFAEKKLAGGFYDAGIDVIIDDTNLAKEQIADYVVADRKVVHDFTHVDVEECLRRNEQRRVAGGNWCSPDVIVKLARKHGLL